jgi:hypothetical protein
MENEKSNETRKTDENKPHPRPVWAMNDQRPWVLVAAWFGTIGLVGLLKRVLERQRFF